VPSAVCDGVKSTYTSVDADLLPDDTLHEIVLIDCICFGFVTVAGCCFRFAVVHTCRRYVSSTNHTTPLAPAAEDAGGGEVSTFRIRYRYRITSHRHFCDRTATTYLFEIWHMFFCVSRNMTVETSFIGTVD